MPLRRARREEPQRQRWLVSYADMMTLLFTLFLVLFACSMQQEGKLKEVLAEVGTEMGATPPPAPSPPPLVAPTPDRERELLDALQEKVGADASVVSEERGVVVTLVDSPLLFDSGSTRLSKAGVALIGRLAEVAAGLPHFVRVEGHTDNVPVGSSGFRSNWELSVLRAAAVTEQLLNSGLAPGRLSVMGYGQHHPRNPNTTAAGRASNRRVEIVFIDPVNFGTLSSETPSAPSWSIWLADLKSKL